MKKASIYYYEITTKMSKEALNKVLLYSLFSTLLNLCSEKGIREATDAMKWQSINSVYANATVILCGN